MFEQNGFDFSRRNRESFVLDHFLAAVEHIVKTVGVGADDIARVVPAIAQNSGGGLRLFPVSQHYLWTAHDEFTRLAGRHIFVV